MYSCERTSMSPLVSLEVRALCVHFVAAREVTLVNSLSGRRFGRI